MNAAVEPPVRYRTEHKIGECTIVVEARAGVVRAIAKDGFDTPDEVLATLTNVGDGVTLRLDQDGTFGGFVILQHHEAEIVYRLLSAYFSEA